MFDIYLRNLKDMLIDPISKLFVSLKQFGVSPNAFTLTSGVFGLLAVYNSFMYPDNISKAFLYYVLNRIFDGIDGTYARMTDQCTDFGGYLDILVDFTTYGLIPIGVTAGTASAASKDDHLSAWLSLALLEVSFFVNAAGLFLLSALIEKNKNAAIEYAASKKKDDRKNTTKGKDLNKEVTAVKMPPALIEGFESMMLFGAIILFPKYQVYIYTGFALAVTITIL